ncbi:hypothetical protein HFP15_10860 [Amycolatopsis sp. K13G38]|uniref:Uncharacterized protein n=1 Tax=Amycolatopsis acididurans TaxID=2724524 RepID=A0ABX1J1W9_9PSEU|nr:hypothetical protein [Amycolatopsis acididurans]
MRGVLLASSSAGLAVTAHALADGELPNTALTLLLTALVGWTGSALAEKVRGPLGILAVLGVAQAAMHLVLTELAGHMGPAHADMYLTHATATAVTALLVARAEWMLRVAVSRLGLLPLVVRGQPPVPAGPAPAPVVCAPDVPLMSVLLKRVHGRRGPPCCS